MASGPIELFAVRKNWLFEPQKLSCSMRFWMSEIDAIDAGGVVGVVGEAGVAGDVGDGSVGVTGTDVGTQIVGTCERT
ncbi:hypothetical protein JCGZ_15003 [Jatropha curcas]|uniref:Uncharacterized protein n=1 Tax=Jatropha curcas TaxID=180498 RepID=A0A067K9T1_JATCU|nr:hypothetical protein JCGZ_15003 [Jatropha curcas]